MGSFQGTPRSRNTPEVPELEREPLCRNGFALVLTELLRVSWVLAWCALAQWDGMLREQDIEQLL